MRELPENKFGFLLLKRLVDGKGVYVKANKIALMYYDTDDSVIVDFFNEMSVNVSDTIDEILEQLENIHPSLR